MPNYNIDLQNNNIDLQEILNTINTLPDASAGGVELPELLNPATENEIFLGEEAIDEEGNKIIGTFTIEEELSEQDDLLEQITTALEGKATGGEQATPEIEVNSSTGLITATAGTKNSTYQLAFQPAKTITPGTTSQIAVSSGYYTGGNVTVAGDSNLVAGNIKSGVSIFGINGTLEEGSGSSEIVEYSENEDAITEGTITSYTNDRITKIRGGAFAGCLALSNINFPKCTHIKGYSPPGNFTPIGAFQYCSSLASVNFPACTSIGSYAFYRCDSLTSISFPVCTSIDSYAFCDCESLTSVNFPKCKSISDGAFRYCSSLASVNFPACTSIGTSAFQYCSSLTSISFPVCSIIKFNAFYDCISLTSVFFPVCTSIGSYAFYNCFFLTSVFFPICTNIGSNAFCDCSSLTSISFPVCTSIGSYAFQDCRTLSSLTLGASTVCTLKNSNAFSSTPYAGYSSYFSGTPYIYVPASLIDAYKSATNWTYFSSYFSTIESLEE